MDNTIIFKLETEISLRHTDAAGVIFYPRLHEIAHEAVERLWTSIGYPLGDMMDGKLHHLPVVHAEADYKIACRVGDKLTVEVSLNKLGKHSLGFTCNFRDLDGKVRATTRVDHVAVDGATGKVTGLDSGMKAALEELQGQ